MQINSLLANPNGWGRKADASLKRPSPHAKTDGGFNTIKRSNAIKRKRNAERGELAEGGNVLNSCLPEDGF